MPKFTLGGYTIDSQKVYDVLKKYSSNSEGILKKLDKNSDKVIAEDELIDIAGLDDDIDETDSKKENKNSEKSSSAEVSDSAKEASNQIAEYEEQNVELEGKIASITIKLAGTKDKEEVESLTNQMQSLRQQINANCNQIYQLLVNKENQSAALTGQNSVEGVNPVPNLTTGKGISGSSDFGNSIVNIASSFAGKLKESDGSYLKVTGGRQEAWCADFVTYCVTQACKETGTSLNGFGSPAVANIKAWGQANNCYSNLDGISTTQKAEYITKNIKPGDVMIQQNGVSHTGIVTKVYPDGSYDTIEGNTSDQCLPRHYSAADSKLSGFVKIT